MQPQTPISQVCSIEQQKSTPLLPITLKNHAPCPLGVVHAVQPALQGCVQTPSRQTSLVQVFPSSWQSAPSLPGKGTQVPLLHRPRVQGLLSLSSHEAPLLPATGRQLPFISHCPTVQGSPSLSWQPVPGAAGLQPQVTPHPGPSSHHSTVQAAIGVKNYGHQGRESLE
jgi:hypothetical protein